MKGSKPNERSIVAIFTDDIYADKRKLLKKYRKRLKDLYESGAISLVYRAVLEAEIKGELL